MDQTTTSGTPQFRVRIPLSEAEELRALALRNMRPLNSELLIAVRKHLEDSRKENE